MIRSGVRHSIVAWFAGPSNREYWQQAVRVYKAFLTVHPAECLAHEWAGEALAWQGRTDQAVDALLEVIRCVVGPASAGMAALPDRLLDRARLSSPQFPIVARAAALRLEATPADALTSVARSNLAALAAWEAAAVAAGRLHPRSAASELR